MNKKVIIVPPKSVTATDKQLLYDNGFIVVQAKDPTKVVLLDEFGLQSNKLLKCYAEAIKKLPDDSIGRRVLSEQISNLVVEMEKQKSSQP